MLKQKNRNQLAHRLGVPEIPFALKRLSLAAFQPKQIFDVGAYRGDFARYCLDVWPQTKIICFEALEDKIDLRKQLEKENPRIQTFSGLIGAKYQDNILLHKAETASSVLTEKHNQNFPIIYHSMRTIDSIVQNHFDGRSPDFLKLDVQGYELEVLKGAEQSLHGGMEAILAEINLLGIHNDVPLLAEVIAWLDKRNWVVYDICALTQRPLDDALWQADFLFTPEDSPLRSDKRWN